MRLKLLSVASATLLLSLVSIHGGSAEGGCGPGFHRGPYGGCQSTRPYSRLTRAAGAAIGPYVYVKQKLRGLTRSFELATEHREGLAATPKQ
jgi:hypothetical protein